jgi:arylsulfatase A
MIWVFPEYGGQVAVRLGDFKVIRQGLSTKSPGAWEVYDLSADHAERHDLARERGDLIVQAEEIFRREVTDNSIFRLVIPGVSDSASKR